MCCCHGKFFIVSRENGVLWTCGNHGMGQCGMGNHGDDSYLLPVRIKYFVENKIMINKIDCGQQHVVVIGDGDIYCWGWNGKGQCGVGSNGDDVIKIPIMIDVLSKKDVVDIRVGNQHSGCITKDGEYWIWGCNCQNECCIKDSENEMTKQCLKIPKCVNQYIFECTKCDKIVDMVLSYCNSMFLVCCVIEFGMFKNV